MMNVVNNQKGQVLGMVLAFVFLMVLLMVFLVNIMKQDAYLMQRVKLREQAYYAAEAGIKDALARLKKDGFQNWSDFSGSLDTGTYDVVLEVKRSNYLITATGASGGITTDVAVEVKNLMPDALEYVMSAGDDVQVYASVTDAVVTGDMRANDDVKVKADPLDALLTINAGAISVVDIVRLGTNYNSTDSYDIHIVINGVAGEAAMDLAVIDEDAPPMTFPGFDYGRYREEAIDSGDYYDTDVVFTSETLSPANGIVFVDGNVTFEGTCTLDGGIVADDIRINGTLSQYKAGDRNVIIARGWQINVEGRLYAEEALFYIADDFNTVGDNADIEINGVVICREDILFQGANTKVDVNYVETYPSDMTTEDSENIYRIISWIY